MRGDGSANLRFTLTTAVLPALTKVRDRQAQVQVDGISLLHPLVQRGKQSVLTKTDLVQSITPRRCCTWLYRHAEPHSQVIHRVWASLHLLGCISMPCHLLLVHA